MKRIVITIFILLLIIGCTAQKKYYLKAQDFTGKKIIFSLQEGSSYQKVDKFGEHSGNSKEPNLFEVLRQSIDELSDETKINMVYSHSNVFPTDSIIPVIVNIKNIDWIFNGTKNTMNVNIEYQLPDRLIKIVGTHKYKIFVAGTKSGNLKKSLKDGHRQLLSAF
ncbi:hypothetical protein FBALC1_10592 [Flavobacteriales bacterium ALC-1]|nr:hypothetical protein FBALC1_10592 [Flavobacteriales bacterium ALC-1]